MSVPPQVSTNRSSFLRRLALPAVVLSATALGTMTLFTGGASGASSTTSTTGVMAASTVSEANSQVTTATPTGTPSVISPAPVSDGLISPAPVTTNTTPKVAYQTSQPNAGTPNSSVQVFRNGNLVAYGNSHIIYVTPPKALVPLGEALYQQNCASCHGVNADGVPADGTPGAYPNLRGLGPATIDFWVESGRMPAANPRDVQANRKRPRLTHVQSLAVVAYVNSLAPATPYIPKIQRITTSDSSDGFSLFALNCAACHTITGGGNALANSTYAPSLRNIPATQVAEAIRTGPGNMPRFTGNLTDAQVRNIVGYVTLHIQHPYNPGGLGLGGLGPVAEGFVALVLGVGILALIGFWIGDRT
jgi:ubiquinol-cytochrome c reductase cytochrome c subunit